jgi:hypothetical protein
MLPE